MREFRSDNRGDRFGGGREDRRGSFRNDRFGGRGGGGFRGRDSGGFQRREMHDVTCDNCKKACQVPFRPTGDKPVLCSDCFRHQGQGDSRSERNFDSRDKPSSNQGQSAGISADQFKQLNAKLDKILAFLESLEFEDDVAEEGEGDEESDEEGEAGSE